MKQNLSEKELKQYYAVVYGLMTGLEYEEGFHTALHSLIPNEFQ